MQGAILLGDGKQPDRDSCYPFDGYAVWEGKEQAQENEPESYTALYPWVVTDAQQHTLKTT
jgi:hypothetical protein